jgi:predicted RecA/RadA family phage recombinase
LCRYFLKQEISPMKNAAQPGRNVPLPAPYAVASGDGLLVGAIFGLATGSASAGESVEATLVGVFDIKKTPSQAWAIGDKIYWDNVAKEATKTATNNTLIGAAIEAVGNSASETTGRVRLNGSV